jgi:predicted component of type VI protein secretion system
MRKGVLLLERGVAGGDGSPLVTLDGTRKTLGRAASADGILRGDGISRHHAEIVFDGNAFVIRDLASTNGTRVDGKDVREAPLTEGAKIALGSDATLTFAYATGDAPDAFFDYVPTRRGVDATTGEAGRRHAAIVAGSDGVEAPRVDAMRRAAPMAAAPDMPLPAPPAPRAAPAPGMPMAAIPRPAAAMPSAPVRPSTAPPPAMVLRSPIAEIDYVPGAARSRSQNIGQRVPHAPVASLASEPYPEHELTWLGDRIRGELDLVFLVDATASKGPFIDEVRAHLEELVRGVRASPLCKSLRIGIVAYRDHPPQEPSFVTAVTPLSFDEATVDAAVRGLGAVGGGDGPEAVTDGLFDVVRLDWRPNAARGVVWFGDAPPHGVEPTGDAFPAGCPCGHHWYTQAESCREMGITFYCVGCLPALRTYVGGEDVFRTVARTTRGMYLPLREAELLVPLIAGAAETALDSQRIDAFVHKLVAEQVPRLAEADPDDRVRWLTEELRASGVRARAMSEDATKDARLRFRDLTATDIRAALTRLGGAGRLPW